MPSTRDIRRRIKSVKNTAQITKAMQMVAASKMRRAQQTALAGRPYAMLMNQMLAEVTANAGDFHHPLIEKKEKGKHALMVISTDKGLCGALNTNLLREAAKADVDSTIFMTVGRKASQFVARTKRELSAEFTYKDVPDFADARAISKYGQELFLQEGIKQVDVLFTNFISTLNQHPELRPFLPVGEITGIEAGIEGEKSETKLEASPLEFQFEPTAGDVLGNLLPHYLNYQIYQLLLECKASEHSARMVAMKSATDNANQLIKDLTLEYNKLRQASITNELLEITSASLSVG
ncbi:MAG: ATP synthase gamma chain, sodium ion specific [Verrucomicrobia subdivision 3 bacterium]|nr:ATP synthase gamma chain, sodium ion specific [Limisphaerales bacterium]MCS1415457.1 ATP synthase gamma chain, sodium ion specific [Limisphaerales bacterium]